MAMINQLSLLAGDEPPEHEPHVKTRKRKEKLSSKVHLHL